jgi:hypothetical protein
MEISQGKSLCSFIHLKLAKTSRFSFIFSTKLESRKVEQVWDSQRVATSGRGEVAGKGIGG